MTMLITLPDTLEYEFVNIRGIVHIHFSIDVQVSDKDIQRVDFYDVMMQDFISLESQYNVVNPNWKFLDFYYDIIPETRDYIKISIPREDFLIKFKDYYTKFLKKHTDVLEKYTKKFDPIARKHANIIEENSKVTKIMKKWVDCKLCYLTNSKGELKKFRDDADGFFEKLDLHQDDKLQNPKVLLKEMINLFNVFPRYPKEFTVWRGMNLNYNVEVGKIIKNPMPFSTSLLPYTARGFLGNVCCMFEVTVPANFPVIFLHKYRFWEKEVILPECEWEALSVKRIKRIDFPEYLGDPNIPWIQQFKRNEPITPDDMIIVKCKILQK